MSKRDEIHQDVLESITEALLQLMQRKPLSEITISELCRRAGVGRVSFYRNYVSLDDVLIRLLNKCTNEWWISFSQRSDLEIHDTFWPELLAQYRKKEALMKLLYQSNASHIIKAHIFSCCAPQNYSEPYAAYCAAALAGCVYGLVDEWIRRGMADNLPAHFQLHDVTSFAQKEDAGL